MSSKPFRLILDSKLQFLFLFTNADGFYVSARYNLQHGNVVPGCLNSHQAIELYIKAILKLSHEQVRGHDLIILLRNYETRESYFTTLLQNKGLLEFLQELSEAYEKFRYGEAGAESNSEQITQLLDELAYNLRTIYLRNIKSPPSKLYIPNDARSDFLKNNKFFTNENLTNNPLAQMMLLGVDDLPDDFFNHSAGASR